MTEVGKNNSIYVHYESIKGGVNNLCVARIFKDGGIWCSAGVMSSLITTGTSEHGKEQAIRNAMRNLRRKLKMGDPYEESNHG